MALTYYTIPHLYGKLYKSYYKESIPSSRVNGRLVLGVNPHTLDDRTLMLVRTNFTGQYCQGAETGSSFPWLPSHYNEVYGKFVGKLHSGGADLGVTFGSLGQTIEMVIDRLGKLKDFFSLKRTSRRRRRRRPKREDRFSRGALASDVLEGEFGWVPLVQDIHNGLVTACGEDAIPSSWVRASSRFTHSGVVVDSGSPEFTTTTSGWGRCTIAAAVSIANPNLWLLNRLGLINPAVVAWDLVPWSFVVNMFVNVNQLLGSLTDFVGLTIGQSSVTYSSSILREQRAVGNGFTAGRVCQMNVNCKSRYRQVGNSIPHPNLQVRIPNVGLNTAVIASALVVQKVQAFH